MSPASRLALTLLLCSQAAFAHVMSMSSGELRFDGVTARLELEIPLYEISGIDSPQKAILDSFLIFNQQRQVERTSGECSADTPSQTYRCHAEYALEQPPDEVEIECRLSSALAPNHVSVLRVTRGDVAEQKVFDYTFSRHTVRFTPPTLWESVRAESGAGAWRILTGPAQLLFLLALAVAARTRKELRALAAAFLVALIAAALVCAAQGWQPASRFIEAAGALTIAYLAVESLMLPDAGGRWLVAAGMGLFHGLYFGVFLQQAEMSAANVLGGTALAGGLLLALFGAATLRLRHDFGEKLFVRSAAGVLFVVGISWFVVRLQS